MTTTPRPLTRIAHLLHGGDYNPEQWDPTRYPGIWDEDIRLMKLAGVNLVSVGIFSWAMLEPEEGRFDFDWLARVLDKLDAGGIGANLATPTGAKPNWLAAKYPEVRRCNAQGVRDPQQRRHNHCYTSPVYREKATLINSKLAERFRGHPALAMWHVSNEYGGECHCPLCKEAFRDWLRARYTSLDELNHAWWSTFWSHRYTDWAQIDAIDPSVHGLTLDWKRFVTHQTVDFFRHESAPLHRITPDVPVTTNTMGLYDGLDNWRFVEHCDLMAWDAYPGWHGDTSLEGTAIHTAFVCDLYRAYGAARGRPWLLMESTPSQVNWQAISPLKRPGVHQLVSLQTIAHGSDGVMYFQWRKSRGSSEKFHGAVVDHVGHEHTRVFEDVAALGRTLGQLDAVVGQPSPAAVGLIFDWENRWALTAAQSPQNQLKRYEDTCIRDWYAPLRHRNVGVEVIESTCDFDRYRLLIAPMLYMLKPGVTARLRAFVEAGGTLVMTYHSGIVNETDLCWLGGWPGDGLRELLGVRVEETDALPEHRVVQVAAAAGHALQLTGEYEARHYADLIHAEGATVAATYASEFYAGRPAVTVNAVGRGQAIYVASRNDARFHADLLGHLVTTLNIPRALAADTPPGVSAVRRGHVLFLLNFTDAPAAVTLDTDCRDALTAAPVTRTMTLTPYETRILDTRPATP